jgi:hypothetical protein
MEIKAAVSFGDDNCVVSVEVSSVNVTFLHVNLTRN